jgi:Rad3-related DNA helicase
MFIVKYFEKKTSKIGRKKKKITQIPTQTIAFNYLMFSSNVFHAFLSKRSHTISYTVFFFDLTS